jgi:mycothiol synthase
MVSEVSTQPRSVEQPDGTVVLPDAPVIPGVRFRRWYGEPDLAGLVDVTHAARRVDGDPDVATIERLRNEYAHLTNSDPATDLLVAEVDGTIVAYARVEWEDQNDGDRTYIAFGYVHPAWRRLGLGRAMLHHGERRLRDIASAHVFAGATYLSSWTDDANIGNATLLAAEGYRKHRSFFLMVRPDLENIEPVPLPDGLEIRLVEPDQLWPLFLADNDAFLDHFGGIDTSEAAFQRWTGDPSFDPSLFVVAWDGDEVAAGIVNSIDPRENEVHGYRRGWLESVFTRRAWRRRGVARALISRSLVLLRDRGMSSAQLGVDSENPNAALHLYESAGFRVSQSGSAWRKDWDLGRS